MHGKVFPSKVVMSDGTSGRAYQALKPGKYDGCGAEIHAGDLYTRAYGRESGSATFPMCRQCRPFWEGVGVAKR